MPANLGIGEHAGMPGGGLHHGLPSSGSMGNLQAMQVGWGGRLPPGACLRGQGMRCGPLVVA